jgi:hypothetical protein
LAGREDCSRRIPSLVGGGEAYKRRLLPLPGGRSVWEKAQDIFRESMTPGTW